MEASASIYYSRILQKCIFFFFLLLSSNIYCEWDSAVPWPTFQNHQGANNQPRLRICLAVFQTWILVKHLSVQVMGFTERLSERVSAVFCPANRLILSPLLPSRAQKLLFIRDQAALEQSCYLFFVKIVIINILMVWLFIPYLLRLRGNFCSVLCFLLIISPIHCWGSARNCLFVVQRVGGNFFLLYK